MTKTNNSNGDLNFTAKLWQAADKMRNNMDAAEYKHVVLGLIFLKYISDVFVEKRKSLMEEGEDPEEKDFYAAENIFYVPEKARWNYLQDSARQICRNGGRRRRWRNFLRKYETACFGSKRANKGRKQAQRRN